MQVKKIRRVVTGNDESGLSGVIWDSDAPNVNVGKIAASASMTDLWVFTNCPVDLNRTEDDGNLEFSFDPPAHGGHFRIVQSAAKPTNYDPQKDITAVPIKDPFQRKNSHTMDKGGQNAYSSPIHQSQTVDYGFLMEGERSLILDDGLHTLYPGDVIVQLGNWHGWTNPNQESLMAFIMMGAKRETENDEGHH
jgi:ferredoxin-like protein FixX